MATAAPIGSDAAAAGSASWEGPLFLVGVPRSGTKLLRDLLNRHARVRIPPIETEFLPFLAQWVRREGPPDDERAFHRLYRVLRRSTYFDYRDAREPPFDWRAWRGACRGRFDPAGLFEGFVRCETGAVPGSGIIWGDKSPSYVRHVDLLLAEFPRSRVVHIVRDVRDVVVSLRKAWGKDIARAAHRWGREAGMAHLACVQNPGRCIEIRYEALIADPGRELARLCDFVGIEFDPGLPVLDRPTENLGDARGRIGVVRDNTGKYRRSLTERELEQVESLAWDTMLALGYAPELARGPRRLGRVSDLVRKLKDGANLVLADLDEKGFRRALRFYINHQRFIRGGS